MSASAARPLPPSLYAETAIAAPDLPRLEGKARATVGVIGGGITGLSTALHLAERGIDVALVEAHEPGWGASGRNGGQVNPGLKPDPDDVERDFRRTWPAHGALLLRGTGGAVPPGGAASATLRGAAGWHIAGRHQRENPEWPRQAGGAV